ncbi:MAG: hypothetical protein JWP89_2677 [Schlesneria sp.]|nr:hypothetical protein [Schlesneria sp.]
MTANRPRFNRDDVVWAAKGRWPDILQSICGVDSQLLDGRHHPCPMCKQGKDCFRVFSDFAQTGGAFCNKCHSEKNGDGFAAIEQFRGVGFLEALELVALYLNVAPEQPNRQATQSWPIERPQKPVPELDDLRKQFSVETDSVLVNAAFAQFAEAKKPITVAALHAVGAELVEWPKSDEHGRPCIAIPAFAESGKVSGYILRRVDGSEFPESGPLGVRKTHMLRGSVDGWVIPGGFERLEQAHTVWRVEGVPDALALAPLLPDDHSVVTNIAGCQSIPAKIDIFEGKAVISIGDADRPGLLGAVKFAKSISGTAVSVKSPKLQFPIVADHGSDLRDLLSDGMSFAELMAIVVQTPEFVSRVFVVEDLQSSESIELQKFGFVVLSKDSRSNKLAEFSHLVLCETDEFCKFDEYVAVVRRLNTGIKPCSMRMTGFVDWLESLDAMEPSDIERQIVTLTEAAPPIRPSTGLLMRSAGELVREFPELRRPVIEELLRVGETMNIIAASKFGKSWLMLLLAFCVACGPKKWLGKFWTTRGKVLYVDNELHPETLAHRLPLVAHSLGLKPEEWADNLTIVNLRGSLVDLKALAAMLSNLQHGEYSVIILDAWYRFQPAGMDENANSDVMALYNLLDSISARIGSAFICVHHSSKGDQSGKATTDVGSGAGSQSRAADCHLVMRAHEADNAVVVDAAVRSWKPLKPFCLRWEFPAWTPADDLDPADIKKPNGKKAKADDGETSDCDPLTTREMKQQMVRLKVLEAYEAKPDGETSSQLAADAGLNTKNFSPIQSSLLLDKLVEPCTVKKSRGSWPGFKISAAGLATVRQLRQLRQNAESVGVSDKDTVTPTTAPPLGGGVCRSVVSDVPEFDDLFRGGQPA